MSLVKGFVMSLGMFSIIPVPENGWNEKYMPLVIPNLPLVGVLIGFLWYCLSWAMAALSVPLLIQSAAATFAPFILTGFIHADGFMDTADAVFSRRSLDEKKRILRDSNVGAFAVIAIIAAILFEFCSVYTIFKEGKTLLLFAFIPAVSRCVAGIALMGLKTVFEKGYGASFRNGTKRIHTAFILFLAATLLIGAWFTLGMGALPLFVEVLAATLTAAYLYKQFQGISGDLCGCVITVGELAALVCMALV